MATTKGISFVNVRAYCEERFDVGAWERVLAAMSAEDREVLESLLAVGWYDLALYARLIRSFDETLGKGDLALIKPLGRFEAERDLKLVHRLFFRLSNPGYAIEKTTDYWRRFHDTGTWNVKRETPNFVTGTLDGWGVVDEALCLELTGYMPRIIELVGGNEPVLQHLHCRARGSSTCMFELRWH